MFGKKSLQKDIKLNGKYPRFVLGIADLKLGTVILPRSESPKAISRLTEFEWYHKIDSNNDLVTPEIDDLLLKAQQTYPIN